MMARGWWWWSRGLAFLHVLQIGRVRTEDIIQQLAIRYTNLGVDHKKNKGIIQLLATRYPEDIIQELVIR
jgi:hypothetical protein